MMKIPAVCLTALLLGGTAQTIIQAQNISVFTSVKPTAQTPTLVLPATHTFQLLAQTGDTLADGSLLKTSPDFTAYVAQYDRNDKGYLSLNHEIGLQQGGVTVFDLAYDNAQRIWNITHGLPVDFAPLNGTSKPCSGTVTPWSTVVYGEEGVLTSDLDSNGYNDAGWLVEIDPETRQPIQKIWKAGNSAHENCVISSDQKTLYWGADDPTYGYVFKYVAKTKRRLVDGKLYVLVRNDSTASSATWVPVPNDTPNQCNTINAFCRDHGAWNFAGIEDVEIGPYGRIYFSAKYSGRVWRFKDNGATISALEVFVENTEYPVYTQSGIEWVQWGVGADNLAFDNANNLWVLQDGSNNHIWMVKPTHTAANPKISLFATTPAGSEPTGITFTPSKRFMFLSFQHPNPANSDTILDATGKRVVFNRGTTIVVARKEFLGPPENIGLGDCSDEKALDVTVWPNPVKAGPVTLHSPLFQGNLPVSIAVFDNMGHQCQRSTHYGALETITLDFRANPAGVYRVRVACERRSTFVTVVVE